MFHQRSSIKLALTLSALAVLSACGGGSDTAPGVVPGTPTGVTATLGSTDSTVIISYTGSPSPGSSAITSYTATSVPAGLSASAASGPITLTCPSSCAGYAFTLSATNASGTGQASTQVDVVTSFDVTATFTEPMTQPNNTLFTGSFILDSTTRTVSGLAGTLSESMTGMGTTPMTLINLSHQLSSVSDGAGGLLVASFALNTVNTFSPSGFADTTNAVYYGYPAAWSAATANSFIKLDLNPDYPTQTPTTAQINRMEYGDCGAGSMMGAACMSGTTTGSAMMGGGGTMGGVPTSQVVTRRP